MTALAESFPRTKRPTRSVGEFVTRVRDSFKTRARGVSHDTISTPVKTPVITPHTFPYKSIDHASFWQNLASGDENTVIVANGGAMSGVFSAGMLTEMHQEGLTNNVDAYAGVSVGAINIAYLLGNKQGEPDPSVYYEKFATPKFIRPGKWPGMVNLQYLRDTLETDLIPGKIRDHPSEFYVGVTRRDGLGELHSTRNFTNKDMIDLFVASGAAPYGSNELVTVREEQYADGNVNGLPLKLLMQKGYTNFGVLLNRPPEKPKAHLLERAVLHACMTGRYPASLKRATIERRYRWEQSMEALDTPGITAAVLAPSVPVVDWLSTDQASLRQAEQLGRAMVVFDRSKHLQHARAA